MTNYHLSYYTLWSAHIHLTTKTTINCPKLKSYLHNLLCVYGLSELSKSCAPLYDCSYFTADFGRDTLLTALKHKIASLRPQAINLIESIDVPDSTLNSSIGNSYGDIYETYFNNARQSKLNKSKDNKVLEVFGDVILRGKTERAKL